jgi:hypothetical protein
MPPRSERIMIVAALLAAALTSCSQEAAKSISTGDLWPYRDRIAQALTLRTGALAGSSFKPVKRCYPIWSGSPANGEALVEDCERSAEEFRRRLEAHLGAPVSRAALDDPALWAYVAPKAKL